MQSIIGNWKMNGLGEALGQARALAARYGGGLPAGLRAGICPPATLLRQVADAFAGAPLLTGGQDCHRMASGAHTGDISAEMIRDAGGAMVIVGHSERRADHDETDALVQLKAEAAIAAGLEPIVCVGETLAEREAGRAEEVVAGQLVNSLPDQAATAPIMVAYEPVWAIGTGRTPTPEDIAAMHGRLKQALAQRLGEAAATRIAVLYGGSVKGANAREILAIPHVGGALVGGASLMADDFAPIIEASPFWEGLR